MTPGTQDGEPLLRAPDHDRSLENSHAYGRSWQCPSECGGGVAVRVLYVAVTMALVPDHRERAVGARRRFRSGVCHRRCCRATGFGSQLIWREFSQHVAGAFSSEMAEVAEPQLHLSQRAYTGVFFQESARLSEKELMTTGPRQVARRSSTPIRAATSSGNRQSLLVPDSRRPWTKT